MLAVQLFLPLTFAEYSFIHAVIPYLYISEKSRRIIKMHEFVNYLNVYYLQNESPSSYNNHCIQFKTDRFWRILLSASGYEWVESQYITI